MKYTIIEDCSPYYIRFTHSGIDQIIDYCKHNSPYIDHLEKTFIHHVFPEDQAIHLLSITPLAQQMPLRPHRVSLFMTKPGRYYRAHKDGLIDRFSINYTVSINDDKCITSWYTDQECSDYQIVDKIAARSRECLGFIKENHTPIKSMIAKPNEGILFNTDIFHDFDNRQSNFSRTILTFRIMENLSSDTYFEDAKKIMFGTDII
jgi:hypothetical protein